MPARRSCRSSSKSTSPICRSGIRSTSTEVPLPKGVELVPRLKADNPVVVTVQVPREIVVEEPTAEAAAAPTTEIISEKPEGAAAAAGAAAAPAAQGQEKEKSEEPTK